MIEAEKLTATGSARRAATWVAASGGTGASIGEPLAAGEQLTERGSAERVAHSLRGLSSTVLAPADAEASTRATTTRRAATSGGRGRAAAPAGRAAAATAKAAHPAHPSGPLVAAIYQPALAIGFARAVLADAGIALLGLAIAIAATRSAAPTSPAPSGQPRLCPPSRHNRDNPSKSRVR